MYISDLLIHFFMIVFCGLFVMGVLAMGHVLIYGIFYLLNEYRNWRVKRNECNNKNI